MSLACSFNGSADDVPGDGREDDRVPAYADTQAIR